MNTAAATAAVAATKPKQKKIKRTKTKTSMTQELQKYQSNPGYFSIDTQANNSSKQASCITESTTLQGYVCVWVNTKKCAKKEYKYESILYK